MEIQYTSNTPLLIYYEYCRKIPDGCVFGKREKPFPSKMLEAPIFSLSLGEITKADIESYLKTALNRGLTVWTIKNYLCYFNHIFRKAVKDGLIEKNPCASIRYATFPPIGHKLLSPSVLCAVLKCLQYRPDGNLYSLIRYTGIFREEAILLRWSDVDFDKKQLHIRKPKKGEISAEFEIYSRSRIIRGKERIIPLSQEAIDVLEDERAAQEKRLSTFSRFSSHELSSSKDLNVFTDNYGNCYNPLDFMHINQWIHEKTGIIDFSSDRLRIQFSLELLQSGVDLKTMSQISGFSAYKTAFNYYLSNERIEAMKRREEE